jgi:hypothetical protein
MVGPTNIPQICRAIGGVARPGYAHLVSTTTSDTAGRSPEAWARALLEDTPTGRSAPAVRPGLGPRPSPDHVQRWKIADRGHDWIRFETSSWFMTAVTVVHAANRRVSVAFFISYDQPIAALIWPPVSVMHMLRQVLRPDGPRADEETL